MNIETNRNDVIASLLKGYLGGLPVLGPAIAEIIGSLIPNQRIDRIAALLKSMESKFDPQEKEKIEAKMLEEKSVDLMEDGFLQAARALSEERIDYIASLLKNSLTDEELEEIAYKKLLSILGELNDIEVLILKSYSLYGEKQQEFREKHKDILFKPRTYLGSSQEEIDKNAIYETYKAKLTYLGLLRIRFKKPNRGELPEFDEKTGMTKASGHDITSLGRLLVRSIDQDKENRQ